MALYDSETPYALNVALPKNLPMSASTNLQFPLQDGIILGDARNLPVEEFSYEKQGFEYLSQPDPPAYHFSSETSLTGSYCHGMIKLVSKEFGADRTLCYDLRVNL